MKHRKQCVQDNHSQVGATQDNHEQYSVIQEWTIANQCTAKQLPYIVLEQLQSTAEASQQQQQAQQTNQMAKEYLTPDMRLQLDLWYHQDHYRR